MKFITGYFFGSLIMGIVAIFTVNNYINTQKDIQSKCNCPTYKDFLNIQSRYEMFVDSLQNNGNKNNRNRLIDSIQKYKL